MDRQLLIRELMQEEFYRCQKLYDKVIREFGELPPGAIVSGKNGLRHFFRKDGRQYMEKIKPDNNRLLRSLRKRQNLKKGMPLLEKRLKNCRRFLKDDILYDPVSIASGLPEQYRDMTGVDVFLEGDINPDDWQSEDYQKGNMFREKLIHGDGNGIAVRSKSEAMIAMKLKESGFCFRYEPEVRMGSHNAFPDFGILLKRIRRVVYWEHLGMMDDPEYAFRAITKIEEYSRNGIYLGYNLIITYETKEKPLTISDINRAIEKLIGMDKI